MSPAYVRYSQGLCQGPVGDTWISVTILLCLQIGFRGRGTWPGCLLHRVIQASVGGWSTDRGHFQDGRWTRAAMSPQAKSHPKERWTLSATQQTLTACPTLCKDLGFPFWIRPRAPLLTAFKGEECQGPQESGALCNAGVRSWEPARGAITAKHKSLLYIYWASALARHSTRHFIISKLHKNPAKET